MANRRFESQFNYSFHAMPIALDCKFVVASSDSAGLGITNLAGGGIKSVLMYSSSPATSNKLLQGYLQVTFNDPYFSYYYGGCQFRAPVTGSEIALTTGLTLGAGYQVTTVGTSTAANWQTAGLPVGLTPAVGQGFIAITASAGTGTGKVKAVAVSGVYGLELIGSPSLNIVANNGSTNGGVLFFKFVGPTDSTHPGPILTQPVDGTAVHLFFKLSNSSVTIQGD